MIVFSLINASYRSTKKKLRLEIFGMFVLYSIPYSNFKTKSVKINVVTGSWIPSKVDSM